MRNLTLPNGVLTMSSLEIAELTGKTHKNVIRDIRNMLDALEKDGSNPGSIFFEAPPEIFYLDEYGRRQVKFDLDDELTFTLLTGYSPVLRRKVIHRWRELETQASLPTPAATDLKISSIDICKALKLHHTDNLRCKLNQARSNAERACGVTYARAEADGMGGTLYDARLAPVFFEKLAPANKSFTEEQIHRFRQLLIGITGGKPELLGLPQGTKAPELMLLG